MKISDIISLINEKAPEKYALSWDNPGLLIGDESKQASRALLALDVTEETANQAVRDRCEIIIAHHPMFFGGIKKLTDDSPLGRCVHTLMKNDIAVYACHTNMDAAEDGINERLAGLFSLTDRKILAPDERFENIGIGRVGKLPNEMSIEELCEKTKSLLKTPFVRVISGGRGKIEKIAVASGSCSEFIPLAKSLGAQAIITADMKYHDSIDAYESGMYVIDAGHYPTEFLVTDIFADILKTAPIEIVISENKDVFGVL